MKTVADTLGISRSNLVERLKGRSKSRGSYRKAEDAELLPIIRRLVDQRPTYGYRRIASWATMRCCWRSIRPFARAAPMTERSWSCAPICAGARTGWSSPAGMARSFVSPLSSTPSTGRSSVANAGISGSDVRDMMLEAVETRFGATRTPHAIEHLSDNGSAYTARDTRLFAQALNLTPCFTPVASPQSNGMSEAFVKTLKRDYVRISALPDAETALRLIDGWIEDYNKIHPHSALKMASPRQFIRAKSN